MDYEKISELAEREHVEDANKLLRKGWVFVKAAETLKLDRNGHQFNVITYVLGRLKPLKEGAKETPGQQGVKKAPNEERPPAGKKEPVVAPPATAPDILSLNIQWRQKKDQNPNFYYAFVNSLDGTPDPVVALVVESIKKNGGGAIIQKGWRFSVKDRFLMRSKVTTGSW